jgi:murein DD-endopeptidase MepM/ murein hydrolase activator NlpD
MNGRLFLYLMRLTYFKFLFFFVLIFISSVTFFSCFTTRVTKNTDSYIYDLPFEKGTSHRVIQGYGGLFSHNHTAAIDFAMPVGTPICAAREGRIYAFKEDRDEYHDKANFIIIHHDDGSFGCYWHLKQWGVLVKQGRVEKGQVIGYSGKTGYTLRAHLHFSVKRKLAYEMDAYVKTKFNTSDGVIFLSNGESYSKPGN